LAKLERERERERERGRERERERERETEETATRVNQGVARRVTSRKVVREQTESEVIPSPNLQNAPPAAFYRVSWVRLSTIGWLLAGKCWKEKDSDLAETEQFRGSRGFGVSTILTGRVLLLDECFVKGRRSLMNR